ncbi:hypothetical protein ABT160_45330 [Streptomyces sp. NPDC001941]|uniref:hypothetical protein n=1 Tax=Streptomyces sp. NPDC001941 TaxID=3154659 RepID=UPI00331A214D
MSATLRSCLCTALLALAALGAGAVSGTGTTAVAHTEAAPSVSTLTEVPSGPEDDNGWW